jgi:hypothetical protein
MQQYKEALGAKADNPGSQRTWMLLNLLASHDLSAMRELFGMPEKVLHAWKSPSGPFMTVTFQ